MAKYKIRFKTSAEKEFDKLDKVLGDRIEAKIDLLESNPYPSGSKKLQGEPGLRLRIGNYRIIYEVDEMNNIIMIYWIAHRSKVYKK